MKRIHHILVVIIFLFLPAVWTAVWGQDYSVASFDIVPTDLTARTNSRADANGRPCAVIKVYVKDAITATGGPVIGEIVDRGMEKWVYVSHDAKKIELLFKEHMPLYITFNDFNYPTVTGQMTYVMKLKEVGESVAPNLASNNVRKEEYISTPVTNVRNDDVAVPPVVQSPVPPAEQSSISTANQSSSQNSILNSGKPLSELDPVIQNLINNMVYIEGGSFMMGSDDRDAYDDEQPIHRETVGSFSIGKYEVTQKEWKAVMGKNPSFSKGNERPVENVSFDDCMEFIRKLNIITGRNFRLPTEEEWEYAARGGNRSKGYKYSGSDDINNVAWYEGNSGKKTHNVGSKDANELGLHDLSENVWEWTSSKLNSDYSQPRNSPNFVYRGGGWYRNARYCRVSSRGNSGTSNHYNNLGLRLAF